MKYSAAPTRHTFPRTRFPLSSSVDLYLVFFSLSDGPVDGRVFTSVRLGSLKYSP